MIEVGRACVKTAGREADQKCLIIETIDDNFVMISGPRVRRRRCNVKHLSPLPEKLSIKKGATDPEVFDAMVKANLIQKEIKPLKGKAKPAEKPVEAKPEEKKEEKPKKKLLKFPLRKKEAKKEKPKAKPAKKSEKKTKAKKSKK